MLDSTADSNMFVSVVVAATFLFEKAHFASRKNCRV